MPSAANPGLTLTALNLGTTSLQSPIFHMSPAGNNLVRKPDCRRGYSWKLAKQNATATASSSPKLCARCNLGLRGGSFGFRVSDFMAVQSLGQRTTQNMWIGVVSNSDIKFQLFPLILNGRAPSPPSPPSPPKRNSESVFMIRVYVYPLLSLLRLLLLLLRRLWLLLLLRLLLSLLLLLFLLLLLLLLLLVLLLLQLLRLPLHLLLLLLWTALMQIRFLKNKGDFREDWPQCVFIIKGVFKKSGE